MIEEETSSIESESLIVIDVVPRNAQSDTIGNSFNCKVLSYNRETNILVFECNGKQVQTNEVKYISNSPEIKVHVNGDKYTF